MQNKYPIGGYAPGNYTCICCICKKEFQGDKRTVQCEPCAVKSTAESDARQTPPSFDEMTSLIKKLFTDYLEDVLKSSPEEIEKAWVRYKTLNHLYREDQTMTGAVWVKGQYDRLYNQLKGEPERKIVCWVDYKWRYKNEESTCRDICTIRGEAMEFVSRGHGYACSTSTPYNVFIDACERLNVEWLDESPSKESVICEQEFIEFVKNERNAFSSEMLSDSWWVELPAAKRVVFENILIAYDQMQERLTPSKESEAVDWISVDDQLPTESGRYWCYVEEITDLGRGYFQWNCAYNQNGKLFTDKSLCNGERITHWRPLPEPPKQAKK
jgi:hypothetical protein